MRPRTVRTGRETTTRDRPAAAERVPLRLRLTGRLELAQVWPRGRSDADTLVVTLDDDECLVTSPTRHFQTSFVRGASVNGRPVLRGARMTVRLEGIDSPELHYRPPQGSGREFRQAGAETAARALLGVLSRAGEDHPRCKLETLVHSPQDVFDCYGRFVGAIRVRTRDGDVRLNDALVARGWAFPALYDGMAAADLARIRGLARQARARGRGLWRRLCNRFDQRSLRRRFRRNAGVHDDASGQLVSPKLFRRFASWAGAEPRTAMTFREYLQRAGDAWIDGVAPFQRHRHLADLLSSTGAPDWTRVVLVEKPAVLRAADGLPVTRW